MTDITAIIKVLMEPGLKTDPSVQASLRPGSVLNGRVTDILPTGLLQINFGKFKTQARVKFPVAQGDSLRFEVLETGDQIKLKIQNPPPAAIKPPVERFLKPEDLSLLRQTLEMVLQEPGASEMNRRTADSTRLLLARISQYLLPLPAGRETAQLAPLIKATLANSGIFFEKRLETVLLQIFKSPDRIEAGRAVSHPFITNVLDNDLKPNLLKLAALLAKTGDVREPTLTSIREASLKLLNQIDTEQARLTRQAPTGADRRAGTYHRTDSSPSGAPGLKTPGLPMGALKTLQLQLVKSGLWSDPEIRAVTRELFRAEGLENDRSAAPVPTEKGISDPAAGRMNFNAHPVKKSALQEALARLIKGPVAQHLKALEPFLKSFHTYIRESRFSLDPKTEAALIRLGDIVREPGSHKVSTPLGTGNRTADLQAQLKVLSRFIENRTASNLQTGFPRTRKTGNALSPDKPATLNSKGTPRDYSGPVSPEASDRAASKSSGRGLQQAALLVEPKATSLNMELNRIDEALARLLADSAGQPDGKKITRTARALRALVAKHQLPSDEAVNRALIALTSEERSSKITPTFAFKSGPLSERLQADLMALRDFIGQQRAELNETLDTLKALLGKTTAETDPGDRPGPERGRGADPLQVITFSLPMEGSQKPARLKVFYPSKRRSASEAGFRISLLLSMERMGPIRADLFAHQKNLEIKFSTENEPARLYIGNHLDRLGDLLDGHYENVNLTAAVDEKTIAAFEYEDLELSANRLVDLQA